MHKPKNTEYAKYYDTYVKLTENKPLEELLKAQSKHTIGVLETLTENQLNDTYKPGKWSIKTLFQHIIDTEIVFAYRAFSIAREEKQHLPGFDQNDYANSASKSRLNKAELIDIYIKTRSFTIALFNYISTSEMDQIGVASGQNLSARAAGYIILGHEKHHLNVLKEKYLNV